MLHSNGCSFPATVAGILNLLCLGSSGIGLSVVSFALQMLNVGIRLFLSLF